MKKAIQENKPNKEARRQYEAPTRLTKTEKQQIQGQLQALRTRVENVMLKQLEPQQHKGSSAHPGRNESCPEEDRRCRPTGWNHVENQKTAEDDLKKNTRHRPVKERS